MKFNTSDVDFWDLSCTCISFHLLFAGKVGGTGNGLPGLWGAGYSHFGPASFLLPIGSAPRYDPSELHHPQWTDCYGCWETKCLLPHVLSYHYCGESVPHQSLLLYDVCCWKNLQTGARLLDRAIRCENHSFILFIYKSWFMDVCFVFVHPAF